MGVNDLVAQASPILDERTLLLLHDIAQAGDKGRTLAQLKRRFPQFPPSGIYRDTLRLEEHGLTRTKEGQVRRPGVDTAWVLAVDVRALLRSLAACFPPVDP